ncbi:unnamed protein product [Discosporangium mesarthrocarpum]
MTRFSGQTGPIRSRSTFWDRAISGRSNSGLVRDTQGGDGLKVVSSPQNIGRRRVWWFMSYYYWSIVVFSFFYRHLLFFFFVYSFGVRLFIARLQHQHTLNLASKMLQCRQKMSCLVCVFSALKTLVLGHSGHDLVIRFERMVGEGGVSVTVGLSNCQPI